MKEREREIWRAIKRNREQQRGRETEKARESKRQTERDRHTERDRKRQGEREYDNGLRRLNWNIANGCLQQTFNNFTHTCS